MMPSSTTVGSFPVQISPAPHPPHHTISRSSHILISRPKRQVTRVARWGGTFPVHPSCTPFVPHAPLVHPFVSCAPLVHPFVSCAPLSFTRGGAFPVHPLYGSGKRYSAGTPVACPSPSLVYHPPLSMILPVACPSPSLVHDISPWGAGQKGLRGGRARAPF